MYIFAALIVFCGANWFTDKIESAGISAMGFDMSDTCGFTRNDALECIKKHVDYNKDQEITCVEFERAKALFMPPRLKAAMWIAKKFGFDVTFDQLLYGCDANRDCTFTLIDWTLSNKTCLPYPADLCKMKTVCDIADKSTAVFSKNDWTVARATCSRFTRAECVKLEAQWDRDDAAAKKKDPDAEKHK